MSRGANPVAAAVALMASRNRGASSCSRSEGVSGGPTESSPTRFYRACPRPLGNPRDHARRSVECSFQLAQQLVAHSLALQECAYAPDGADVAVSQGHPHEIGCGHSAGGELVPDPGVSPWQAVEARPIVDGIEQCPYARRVDERVAFRRAFFLDVAQ